MTKEEFVEKHCKLCNIQKCEGVGTDRFNSCHYKNELDGYEDKNEHIDIEEINRIYKHINDLFNKQVKARISTTDTNGSIIYGWICPRCGKVLAPDVKECTCKPEPKSNTKTYIDDKDPFLTVQPEGHCRIVSPEYRRCENKDNPTYEKCRVCSQWVICKPEPKSNINNSFYNTVEPSGFCKIEHKYTWCPQTPSYNRCQYCSDWVTCIPV